MLAGLTRGRKLCCISAVMARYMYVNMADPKVHMIRICGDITLRIIDFYMCVSYCYLSI